MADIQKTNTYLLAYKIDETSLRQMNDLFAKIAPKIEYEIETKDNAKIEFDNFDELLNFSNTDRHQITQLIISTAFSVRVKEEIPPIIAGGTPHITETLKEIDTRIIVVFNKKRERHNTELLVKGKDAKEVFYYFDETEKKIEMLKRSSVYSFAAFLNIGAALAILILLYSAINVLTHWPQTSILDYGLYSIILSCAILLIPTVGYFIVFVIILNILERLQKNIFPVATFAIGDGIKRDQRADFWRTSVIVGGFVIPLVFLLLQTLISR